MSWDSIIFDLEGVLLEGASTSDDLYQDAMHQALDQETVESLTEKEYATLVWPKNKQDIHNAEIVENYQDICDERQIDKEQFWQSKEEHAEKLEIDGIKQGTRSLYPTATEILQQLSQDHQLGLVSNNTQGVIDFVVNHFEFEALDVWYGLENSTEGFERRKPNPHYINQALDRLNSTNAVYVGDKETDMIAADRANIDFIYVGEDPPSNVEYQIDDISEIKNIV